MPTLRTSPGLEDVWQLHWGYGAGIEQNSAGVFIANVDDNQTIANALTAPPRGFGPGRGGRGPGAPQGAPQGAPPAGPPQGAPAGPPPGAPAAAPGQPAPQGPPPGGPGRGAGRGGFGAQGHTPAYWIKVVAQADGSFTVTNARNGFSKTYAAKKK
jgi:hypothetical protein